VIVTREGTKNKSEKGSTRIVSILDQVTGILGVTCIPLICLTVFTSPEIVNDVSFLEEVTNRSGFRERLCCVAIDEAHLTEEWKDFEDQDVTPAQALAVIAPPPNPGQYTY